MRAHHRVASRNARFQQWQTLLTNRQKRQRAGRFLVQGVRPLTLAAEQGWRIEELLVDDDRRLSRWAEDFLDAAHTADADVIALPADMLAELGEKDQEAAPELLAVVAMPPDDLIRIQITDTFLGVAFDRPAQPGNLGTLIRSADAFGADGVVVTGHAADVYDPRTVRASTGSLFGLPTVRTQSHREVLEWLSETGVTVVGTDEDGDTDIEDYDFCAPTLFVVGNEAVGMSTGWREACDRVLSIPMRGTASSLNAANAATVVLYEAARQRRQK
ncbi:tRNA/rRNA methyltransferase (SpoU) [Catenulispora acidiphila DSM 44928]|uniref:tRNA/rRNA methyltransferase (SpoU) n=1 Tax=Catenulispora acidiphila (strain DSM 44928 / JCM 14897 / NBRC 102108 / NRRL B-24433 / ID139908) TaxID=479433 RepID=C7PYV4_CATAD|nr:TrmH family RNA methyltransferase [Catenulispora acidiphila]ACU69510.1 tRNA/rRNA methyltransferase (SpoU) [Catenulispora acidiphila DSM 44928]